MIVYIAGPYTKPDPEANTEAAIRVWSRLRDLGFTPICPHLTHYIEQICPRPYEEWMAYDFELIPLCHAIFRMPGESSGADRETELAARLEIPVFHEIHALEIYRNVCEALGEGTSRHVTHIGATR